MTLAFDYMVLADALTGSAVRLRSVLERDAPNVNARSEDADWLDNLAAVCRPTSSSSTIHSPPRRGRRQGRRRRVSDIAVEKICDAICGIAILWFFIKIIRG